MSRIGRSTTIESRLVAAQGWRVEDLEGLG